MYLLNKTRKIQNVHKLVKDLKSSNLTKSGQIKTRKLCTTFFQAVCQTNTKPLNLETRQKNVNEKSFNHCDGQSAVYIDGS